jgi:ketosteroid isomerase-like protein
VDAAQSPDRLPFAFRFGWWLDYHPLMKKIQFALFTFSICFALQTRADLASNDVFVRDFYAAYKAKDAVRMAEFYTADATFFDPSSELDLRGPDQIRESFTKVFPKYESLDWQIVHTTPAGDGLIVEGNMIGKISGKTVHVPFVSIFHFRNGKISAQRDMFDVLHFFVQLGVVQSPFIPKPSQ